MGDFGRYVIETKLNYFSHDPLSLVRPQRDREATYPRDFGRCWVFDRVLSLGWTPNKFAEFDRSRIFHRVGRSPHKAERFGKKYQWIALRELLARIADNFHMTDRFSAQPATYAGPWQFFGRDIDPTLPPPPRKRDEHEELELSTTFAPGDEAWWVPPGPSYRRDDPPVGEGWAAERDDIPEFEALLRKIDNSGTRWVALCGYYNWDDETSEGEKRQDRRRRNQWSHVYSWLIRPADRDALVTLLESRSLMNRWMPEGHEHTSALFLGELPWAAAANEYPQSWQEIVLRDDSRPTGIEVYPTWAEYLWEGGNLDCSIEDGIRAMSPSPVLFDAGKLSWMPGSRTWFRTDGTEVAQYYEGGGHKVLLVREDWLKKTIRKTGHWIVFGRLGEKQLFEAGFRGGLVGDWTEINGVASITDTKWTFGKRRLEQKTWG